jgi:hypothetical protein
MVKTRHTTPPAGSYKPSLTLRRQLSLEFAGTTSGLKTRHATPPAGSYKPSLTLRGQLSVEFAGTTNGEDSSYSYKPSLTLRGQLSVEFAGTTNGEDSSCYSPCGELQALTNPTRTTQCGVCTDDEW